MRTHVLFYQAMKDAEIASTRSGFVSLARWCEQAGLSPVTAWRYRKRGWLKTINIAGRQYLTDEAAREFTRRAEAGDFARDVKTPSKRF